MRLARSLQWLSGGLLLLLLSGLFFLGQVDRDLHAVYVADLLTLQRLDAEFDQQLAQVESGYLENFDPLVKTRSRIRRALDDVMHYPLDDRGSAGQQLQGMRVDLQALFAHKFALAARYVQQVAAMRASQHHLPRIVDELMLQLGLQENIDDGVRRLYAERIGQLFTETLRVLHLGQAGSERVDDLVAQLSPPLVGIPPVMRDPIISLQRHASATTLYAAGSRRLLQQLRQLSTGPRLAALYRGYRDYFDARAARADRYRYGFFMLFGLLLLYLASQFWRMQRDAELTGETLQELQFQQFALDQHAIVSITDLRGNITYANDRFCQISQYDRDELIGRNHRMLKSDRHTPDFYRNMWHTISRGRVWHGVICNRAKDGSLYWLGSTIVPRLGADGKPVEYIGMRTDITQQILAEQRVQELARFPQENPEPVMRVDLQGQLVYANQASQPVLAAWGVQQGQALPADWQLRLHQVMDAGKAEEIELITDEQVFLLNLSPVPEAGYLNIYGRDITRQQQVEQQLSQQATYDQLTGLYNRYSFEQLLTETIEAAHWRKSNAVLVYIDLDQFKIVNDTCGHVAGDELLRQLGQLLVNDVRESDVLARLGGDEFGLLLRDCSLEQGLHVADKLQEEIRSFRFGWEGKSFDVGASMGVVAIDQHSSSLVEVLGAADVACYAAKDAGRNQMHVFRQDDEETARRQSEMHWASEIPRALADDRLQLMAQSIMPLQPGSGQQGHYEILVRMLDKDGGLIPPGAFIPAAERYNLMSAVDHWVIDHVFDFIARQHEFTGTDADLRMAINLSGDSMARPELLALIGRRIKQHDLPPGMLSFEVTETAAISNLSEAVKFISELRELGCQFALDDFGSGLSSFAYLKNLPVDYLKIDGAFVRDILVDPIDASMVEAINQIGHVMGIRTIAEFAENDEIIARLREIGVDYAQGYGIDRPRPLEEVFGLAGVIEKSAN